MTKRDVELAAPAGEQRDRDGPALAGRDADGGVSARGARGRLPGVAHASAHGPGARCCAVAAPPATLCPSSTRRGTRRSTPHLPGIRRGEGIRERDERAQEDPCPGRERRVDAGAGEQDHGHDAHRDQERETARHVQAAASPGSVVPSWFTSSECRSRAVATCGTRQIGTRVCCSTEPSTASTATPSSSASGRSRRRWRHVGTSIVWTWSGVIAG